MALIEFPAEHNCMRYLLALCLLSASFLFSQTAGSQSTAGNQSTASAKTNAQIQQLQRLQGQEIDLLKLQVSHPGLYNPSNSNEFHPVTEESLREHIKVEQKHVTNLSMGAMSDRLHKGGASDQELLVLSQAKQKAEQTGTDEDLASAADVGLQLAYKYHVESNVSLATTKPGATVKYQTYGERLRNGDVHTVGDVTSTFVSLPIGIYYVWAERKKAPTSDKDAQYPIVKTKEAITLSEQ
jgi:hypothetical protein